MSFIIDRYGNKHRVEDHEQKWFSEKTIVYSDGAELQDFWLVNLYKACVGSRTDAECIKQIEYTHEPTKEEVMYQLGAEGLSRFDFATIEKGYRLDWEDKIFE